jgi:hypothetical protein
MQPRPAHDSRHRPLPTSLVTHVLHLYPFEITLFRALVPSLREGWDLREETLQPTETGEELTMRREMFKVDLAKSPYAERVKNPEDIAAGMTDMPLELMVSAFFALGIAGMSAMLATVLADASTDSDIEGAALISHLRHSLLETDAR